jgi:hypothetical protein
MQERAIVDRRPSAVPGPTLELLAWLHEHPRTYAETIEAWRSTCPRLSVWEDALADDLVEVVRGRELGGSMVVLTARGLDVLA